MTFVRPKYGDMKKVAESCMKRNLRKAISAIIFMTMIYTLVSIFAAVPMMISMDADSMQLPLSVIAMVFAVGAYVVLFMLLYGLNVTMSKIVEKTETKLSYLFCGFKDESKRVIKLCLFFTLLYMIVIAIVTVFGIIYRQQITDFVQAQIANIKSAGIIPSDSSEQNIFFSMAAVIAIVLIFVLFLISCPFLFSMLLIYSEPHMKVSSALGNSAKLLWGKFFHFIGFELYTGGWWILGTIVIKTISLFLPENMSSLQSVLDFVGLITQFIAMARVCIAFPVYFYSATGRITMKPAAQTETESGIIKE